MPCSWEGNRGSGVTLAMRHRLQWFIHLQAHSLRKGDEHPPHGVWHTLPLKLVRIRPSPFPGWVSYRIIVDQTCLFIVISFGLLLCVSSLVSVLSDWL